MINATIDASDLLAKAAALPEWATLRRDVARAIQKEAVLPALAKYPTQQHKKQPFKSAGQRKYFFAALKKGAISVPYRRSGRLGIDWQAAEGNDGLTLTSTAPYSDLVRTKGKQSDYHKGNWPTTDDIATEAEGGTAPLIATSVVVELLQKAGVS